MQKPRIPDSKSKNFPHSLTGAEIFVGFLGRRSLSVPSRVYARAPFTYGIIKNALPVSCLHNRILRETTLMPKIYQYIKKIYPIVTSKRLLRKHNRFHVTAAILTPSFVRVTKNFCQ